MFAALLLDHRVAFVCLAALLMAAAASLAFAWVRVIPEEPPPFAIEGPRSRSTRKISIYQKRHARKPGPVAIALLVILSLIFVYQLPGLLHPGMQNPISNLRPVARPDWFLIAKDTLLVLLPFLAVAHSVLNLTRIRISLGLAGAFILLLWLLGPLLYASLVAP